MTEHYEAMIIWARDQIIPHLDDLGIPDLRGFKANGWDALSKPYQDLMLSIFHDALEKEKYELSYQQTCSALYQAFQTKGWVK
jgi:hypothetical protein